MNNKKNWFIAIALGSSVFCESMGYTYIQQSGAEFYYSSSLLYFISGIAICVLPLFSINETTIYFKRGREIRKYLPVLFFCLLAGLFVFHVIVLSALYKRFPINAAYADMLPVIELSCKRLLNLAPVYAPMNEISRGEVNAYLPMMWLPYIPAVILKFDLRWATVTVLFIALFIAAIPVFKASKSIPAIPFLITCICLFMVCNFFLTHGTDFWAMSEEGVVTGFYILLGYALLQQNYYLTGLGIALCLLSRYSLILWIPVYLIFLYLKGPLANFKKTVIVLGVFVLIVFVLPFFIWDPLYFFKLPFIQAGSQDWFWEHNKLGVTKDFTTVGLYKFFSPEYSHLMMPVEFITSIIFPVIMIWQALKRKLNTRFIGFSSLKLSLVFFYNFIPVPYNYLFFPGTFISYALLFYFISTQVQVSSGGELSTND
jgi:hypothetical protein